MSSETLSGALEYAEEFQWRVIPLRGKSPFHDDWPHTATTDQGTIQRWWKQSPGCNVGVVTGIGSRLLVVDIDPKKGGSESLRRLESTYRPLPRRTPTVETGGGGQHIYLAHPCNAPIGNPTNVGGFSGIDIRADGGQVVAPPSIHPDTRKPYQWRAGCDPRQIAPAPCPQWLLGLIETNKKTRAETILDGGPIPEGQRDDTLASIGGKMRYAGATQDEIEAALTAINNARCKPPKDGAPERVAKSVARYEAGKLPGADRVGGIPVTDAPPPPELLAPVSELVAEGLELARRRNEGEENPVPVPWPTYGEIIAGKGRNGYWPGCHVLVAGTGAGKTAFACDVAVEAAGQGVPTAYIGLELDRAQVGLRFAAPVAGIKRWSEAYTGRANATERARFETAGATMADWPLFATFGDPGGWPADRLQAVAEQLRERQPDTTKPALIVLDFLQLIGDPVGAKRMEIRERIGRASYLARQVGKDYGAAVLVISSMARDKYNAIRAAVEDNLFVGSSGPFMMNPDSLVGLGKESGEIEFSADTVTVLARGGSIDPREREMFNGARRWLYCAVPKLRTGPPSWCVIGFTGGGFVEIAPEDVGANRKPDDKKDKGNGNGKAKTETKIPDGAGL